MNCVGYCMGIVCRICDWCCDICIIGVWWNFGWLECCWLVIVCISDNLMGCCIKGNCYYIFWCCGVGNYNVVSDFCCVYDVV